MGRKNIIKSNRKVIAEGLRDGVPIGLGYLAVSFSLGIAAKNAGLNFFQSFLASLLCNASAGEYSGFTVIAADATYFEFFGITISRKGSVNPYYTYGAIIFAGPCWAVGTALGTIAGNVLPLRVVSALSVALFGMFLAIIVPPTKSNKPLMGIVIFSFIASLAFAYLPVISEISEGTRTIILTVIISAAAALLFPVKDEEGSENVA